MKTRPLAALACVIMAGLLFALESEDADTRPSRSECIAGADLLWTGREKDRTKIINQIAAVFGKTRNYPIGGQGIRAGERIYIIFTRDCGNKRQMMAEILEVYRRNILGFPDYRLLEDPIQPSTRTVEVYGDEWSDGKPPDA